MLLELLISFFFFFRVVVALAIPTLLRMGLIGALVESIPAYTGLSATTFFTIMGLVVAVYYLIAAMLAPPPVKYVPADARPAPLQIGVVTAEELRQYDGSDPTKPLLMAIKSHIYDVSQSRFVSRFFSSLLTLNFFLSFLLFDHFGCFLLVGPAIFMSTGNQLLHSSGREEDLCQIESFVTKFLGPLE